MKKLVILMLTLTLVLTSCVVAPLASAEAAKTLNVLVWKRDDVDVANMQFYKDLEAKTGVHVNITSVLGADWATKTNLMLTSGDYPDIIIGADGGRIDVEMYGVDQEILLPVDEYITPEKMPNYFARFSADPSMAGKMTASDGKMYYFGYLVPQNINVRGHLFVNQTWLDRLNLKVPTTTDEFEAVLKAFRDQDADGDGDPNNEMPFSAIWNSNTDGTQFLLSFWGIPWNADIWLQINDDNTISSPLRDVNLRAAMETLHKWYADGLLDIECINETNSEGTMINAAAVGSFWRWRMQAMGTTDDVVAQYKAILPVSANGITPKVLQELECPRSGAMITSACKDIDTALAWLDALYDVDTQFNSYYGPYEEKAAEDGTITTYGWKYKDDGKITFYTADVETVPNLSSLHFFAGEEYFSLVEMPPQRVEKTEYCKAYTEAGVVEKNSGQILTKLCIPTLEETEEAGLLKAEIDKYANEALVNFITSGVTDDNWNSYLGMLNNLRLDRYIELYQGIYNRYLESQQ